ncbi:hypothetical protein [Acinetobacter sp. DSM 11652]|uniref:hypothetical protein n=1 Tax=Acinetobacter sp. DSM 11652 TaxID=346222 RepID=UPI0008AE4DB3|nr:hypothetical protein [Acinetobacter sp. DSM 11652]SEL52474.1 hypothetical protein SAMN05216500_10341 [Acinetobacter sp. DSM 11652]
MFKPFKNGTESHSIHDLTLENDLDRVSIYGNLQITKDQAGLAAAKALKQYLDAMVIYLEDQKNLAEKIETTAENEIENPFL